MPEDEEGRSAARLLSREVFARSAELPRRRVDEVGPGLDPAWRRLTGLAEELAAIQDAIEAVLAPNVTRVPSRRPPGVRGVRGVRPLRYALPEEADEQTDTAS